MISSPRTWRSAQSIRDRFVPCAAHSTRAAEIAERWRSDGTLDFLGRGDHQINEAKRICLACPVRKRCLAWALELGAASGIWGGTTEDERRALRRAAARHRNRARDYSTAASAVAARSSR